MIRMEYLGESPNALGRAGRLVWIVVLGVLASCGKGGKEVSEEEKSPVPPKEALRELASRPERPPGLPTSMNGRANTDRLPNRILGKLRDSEQEEFASLVAAYRSAGDPSERIDAIEAMSDLYSEELIAFLSEALGDESAEVRVAALEALAGNTSTSAIDLAMKALIDSDETVRSMVPDVLRNVPDLGVVPVLIQGLVDPEESVRFAFLDAASEMGPEISDPVLEAGLQSGNEEIRDFSLMYLKTGISHSAFKIIIEALDSPDPHFREIVSMEVFSLVGETFSNSAEARTWYAANKSNLDDELFPKEP